MYTITIGVFRMLKFYLKKTHFCLSVLKTNLTWWKTYFNKKVIFSSSTFERSVETTKISLRIFQCWQPKRHIRTSWSQHHVLGIELNALHGPWMIGIQNANFISGVGIPNVNPAIGRTAEDELRIGTERCLDGDSLVVQVSCESLQRCSVEGVD